MAAVALYLSAALIGAIVPGSLISAAQQDGPDTEILLVAGPIHYDFLLPLNASTRARFSFLNDTGLPLQHPNARWLVVGWGAYDFYTTVGSYNQISTTAVLKGIFGDRSVMRVDVIGALRDDLNLPGFTLHSGEYAALTDAIADSFSQDPNGEPQPIDFAGFNDTDQFYEAKGRFNILRTCNTWVGRMLRASGRRFGAWTPLPYSVTLSRWLHW
ncbi:TIGR02117 family protein [Parasedimentitalea maritima]|uniref:TIGR02117 family protein n=1 Tax=Parasedimentitalea maritima TaxID=2578117 RepID=A0ABY2V129_9RHOB|nr:TIGR02117 family protein [Zongyanglinia marina]